MGKAIQGTPTFNFDSWATLARSDPQAFEEKRKELIEQAIDRAPARSRRRLRGLQWQLDQIRNTSRTPLAACLRMQRMLWDKLTGEAGLLESLQGAGRGGAAPACQGATILPFRRG